MPSAAQAATQEEERAWLYRVADGDRQAFELLYRAYQRRVAAYVFRMLGDAEAAGEITNDVLVAVWKQAERYEGRSKPSTWIFGIAHHKALNELRRRGRRETVALEDAPEPVSLEARADQRLAAGEQSRALEQAIEQLSSEQREVIQLAFFQNLGYQEIAEIQGCPLNTVKTRMFHAKKKLEPMLRRMGLGGDAS